MARVLEKLDAPLIERHWSDACFIMLRRLFGLHHELLILLVPEMIAKRYFRALRDGTRDPILHGVFAQILHDEEGHLAFHIDYLQRSFVNLPVSARLLLRSLWRLVFQAACLVVVVDHRSVLRGAGVSPAAFCWDCSLIFDEVAAGVFSCALTPAFARRGPGLWTDRTPIEATRTTCSSRREETLDSFKPGQQAGLVPPHAGCYNPHETGQ